MTQKEALEILDKTERCYGDECPAGVSCETCPYSTTNGEYTEAYDLAKKTLENSVPEFHLQCLMCGGEVGLYSAQTMEQVSYTHYSYCEDCLRKGLKLLKGERRKTGELIPRQEAIRAAKELIRHAEEFIENVETIDIEEDEG